MPGQFRDDPIVFEEIIVELPTPEILYHQHKILVVNKPGGLLTQGPPGIDSLELRVRRWQKNIGNPEKNRYLGTPHRLDRPVSGVIVFATNKSTTNQLCKQFESRLVIKSYWTLVSGTVQPECGTWVDFMRKLPDEAKSEIADEHSDGSQLAILRYQVLKTFDSCSLLEIQLETGRTHQIRLQTGSRKYPILGDELYGSQVAFGPPTSDLRLKWIALHARRIAFAHPITHQMVDIIAALPSCWPAVACDPTQ